MGFVHERKCWCVEVREGSDGLIACVDKYPEAVVPEGEVVRYDGERFHCFVFADFRMYAGARAKELVRKRIGELR